MKDKRARKSEKLEHRVFTRIGKEKYEQLSGMLQKTRYKTMSELLRNILQHQQITVITYDATLDKVMEQLSGIRKELQAIGININQITRQFHLDNTKEGRLFKALEIAKLYQEADLKISELFVIVGKISKRWLQG